MDPKKVRDERKEKKAQKKTDEISQDIVDDLIDKDVENAKKERKNKKLARDIETSLIRPDPDTHQFSLEDKALAIARLEISRRCYGKDGRFIPYYAEVERQTGIDKSLLHKWWDKRDEIKQRTTAAIDSMLQWQSFEIVQLTQQIIDDFKERDLSSERLKDVMNSFSTFMNKLMLLQGRSTENVAHKHEHEHEGTVKMKPVIPNEGDDDE